MIRNNLSSKILTYTRYLTEKMDRVVRYLSYLIKDNMGKLVWSFNPINLRERLSVQQAHFSAFPAISFKGENTEEDEQVKDFFLWNTYQVKKKVWIPNSSPPNGLDVHLQILETRYMNIKILITKRKNSLQIPISRITVKYMSTAYKFNAHRSMAVRSIFAVPILTLKQYNLAPIWEYFLGKCILE